MIDIWTLYRNPSNHDNEWVVRLFRDEKPTDRVFESDSRDECEAFVRKHHPGAHWLNRMAADEPVIVGTWI